MLDDAALHAYADERQDQARQIEAALLRPIREALDRPDPSSDIYAVVFDVFDSVYRQQVSTQEFAPWKATPKRAWDWFKGTIEKAIGLLKPEPDRDGRDTQAQRMASWLSIATLNGATLAGSERVEVRKTWATRLDDRVRSIHRPMHGKSALLSEAFTIGGFHLMYPGEPVGPPEVWINCRCILQVAARAEASMTATTTNSLNTTTWVHTPLTVTFDSLTADSDITFVTEVEDEADILAEMESTQPTDWTPSETTPWHGVLVVEGTESGDGRMFEPGALSWRDLPLPLSWQKQSSEGHNGSVIVGRIDDIRREGGEILGDGVIFGTPEADEALGLLSEGGLRGVSVDVDSVQLAVDEDEDPLDAMLAGKATFSQGRISGATLVGIPAFSEAFVTLGARPDHVPVDDAETDDLNDNADFRDVSTEERKGLADKGEAMPDGSYPIANCDDLHNAVQAIGRAKDPEAVKRHIKKRANALSCPGFELPEDWAAEVEEFSGPVPRGPGDKRGPGWVTEPKATRRIHAYWTTPGKPGYAKIGWGAPGDFNRCKRQLSKYVPTQWLNRTCAEWHKDALGYWPGEHATKVRKGEHSIETETPCGCGLDSPVDGEPAAALSLVASGATSSTPASWFDNPGLTAPTPLTVTDDGWVFGHLATWGTCHIGVRGVCTTAPNSETDYAYFRTGVVTASDGSKVSVGQITLGTGHAGDEASPRAAAYHYDDTGACVADVACGEDDYGIWVAGALRDGVTEEQVHALQAGALSGDWRRIAGNLELVAALVVNVPGFPIPRTSVAASGGVQVSLVASGIVVSRGETGAMSLDTVVSAVLAAMARRDRVAAVSSQVKKMQVERLLDMVGSG